jgi:hypothetical protein
MRTKHCDRRHILIYILIRGIYCRHLFILLITIITDNIKRIICHNFQESAVAIIVRVTGLRRVRTQNGHIGFILNATQ